MHGERKHKNTACILSVTAINFVFQAVIMSLFFPFLTQIRNAPKQTFQMHAIFDPQGFVALALNGACAVNTSLIRLRTYLLTYLLTHSMQHSPS
jgi:hypothetical protein